MKKKWLIAAIAIVVAAAAVLAGAVASDVEQARYEVAEQHGTIEVRNYAPHIVAEVNVSGERETAISQGFRLIAGYIFGDNQPAQKVAMTAPVQQQATEENSWLVRFVMPANYTMASLPKPNNDAVQLREMPAKKFAVIQFSGRATNAALQQQTSDLNSFLQKHNFIATAAPIYDFYNPPWTLPFLRRNEVMVQIAQ
jgi:hypothetical protein